MPNAQVQLRSDNSTCALEFAPGKVPPSEKPNDYDALVCCNYR